MISKVSDTLSSYSQISGYEGGVYSIDNTIMEIGFCTFNNVIAFNGGIISVTGQKPLSIRDS